MSIEVQTFTAPSHWACYLVNGDCTYMDDPEIALCDKWCESIAPFYVVSDVEDSERFTWHGKIYGADCDGVTVCDYVAHRIKRAYRRKAA